MLVVQFFILKKTLHFGSLHLGLGSLLCCGFFNSLLSHSSSSITLDTCDKSLRGTVALHMLSSYISLIERGVTYKFFASLSSTSNQYMPLKNQTHLLKWVIITNILVLFTGCLSCFTYKSITLELLHKSLNVNSSH